MIATLSGIGRVPDASAMIYLTAAASTVHFPALGRTVRPGRGSLLTWRSVDEEGHQLPASAHAVSAHPASAAQPRIAVSIPIVKGARSRRTSLPGGGARFYSRPTPPLACGEGAGGVGTPPLACGEASGGGRTPPLACGVSRSAPPPLEAMSACSYALRTNPNVY